MENQTQKRVIRKIAVHIEADPSLPEIVFNSQPVEFVLQATNPDEMEKQTNELRRKLRKKPCYHANRLQRFLTGRKPQK